MGLVYKPGEGRSLVSKMKANLSFGQAKVDRLMSNCQHATKALNGSELSGETYTSADNLINGLMMPIVSQASGVLSDIRSDLARLEAAMDNAGDELLDESKLQELLQVLKKMQKTTEAQIEYYVRQMIAHSAEPGMSEMYSDMCREAEKVLAEIKKDIKKIKAKLERLWTFTSETSGLFGNSVSDLDEVSTRAMMMGAAKFDRSGGFVFKFDNDNDFQKFKDFSNSGDIWFSNIIAPKIQASILKGSQKFIDSLKGKDYDPMKAGISNNAMYEIYESYKNDAEGMTAMTNFLKALENKPEKAQGLYNELMSFTKNQAEMDSLNQIARNLQVTYPEAKLRLRDERPEVMENDELVKTTLNHEYGGVIHGAAFIVNKTTDKFVDVAAWGAEGEFYKSLEQNRVTVPKINNSGKPAPKYSKTSNIPAGVVASLLNYNDMVKSNEKKSETMKGSDYLRQKAENEMREQDVKEKETEQREIKNIQNISGYNGRGGQ